MAIHWFRRDLRLHDNTALALATQNCEQVIGLFILDPTLLDNPKTCPARVGFMYSSLAELASSLADRGGRLIIRRGKPVEELRKVFRETGANRLYFNRDYTTFARKRDERVESELTKDGIEVVTCKDLVIFEKEEILNGSQAPYRIYGSYKRRWLIEVGRNLPPEQRLRTGSLKIENNDLKKLKSLDMPRIPGDFERTYFMPAGEKTGLKRLEEWAQTKTAKPKKEPDILDYAASRDLPAQDGTSQLSVWLRFGVVSPRQCYRVALDAREQAGHKDEREGCDTWVSEFIWRDFFYQLTWNFPFVATESFQPKFRKLAWETNNKLFKAWCEGQTGFPIVDAGMRQLNSIYWMHNRVRMITAGFLAKDLLLDWRLGERYFWEKLVDYDQPANNGNWQWAASTGADSQPYFQIFNPTAQGKKFDPTGDYVRRWVPELAKVPAKYIHSPEKMPAEIQKELGLVIGKDYPLPIVNHTEAQERTLQAYRAASRG
ncbi:MAG: hypothetical protein BGO39_19060 [Chloroflexi bacterium 54-19]|nr:MAG: hypothetical protein BGO39_19060 [Chloroflexi bacterium 54-19]